MVKGHTSTVEKRGKELKIEKKSSKNKMSNRKTKENAGETPSYQKQ